MANRRRNSRNNHGSSRRYRTDGSVAYQPEFEEEPYRAPSRPDYQAGRPSRRPEQPRRTQPRPRRRPALRPNIQVRPHEREGAPHRRPRRKRRHPVQSSSWR